MKWIHILDSPPEINQSVIFTAYIDHISGFTDIEIGEWTGKITRGDAIAMDYGHEDDWLPCTHWAFLPELPIIKEDR